MQSKMDRWKISIVQKMTITILILLLIACSSLVAKSEETQKSNFKHPLTDMPTSAEDVETAHYFPTFTDLKFPIGQNVISLCHFSNQGAAVYNITAIMGSLNSPFDFRHHFQNYSYRAFGVLLKSGEEISLKYGFQLHPELEPIEYQLAITVFYDSEEQSFSNTYFNQTVELYFPTSEYDLETLSSLLLSLFSVVLVTLITIIGCFPDSRITDIFFTVAQAKGGSVVLSRGGSTPAEDDEDTLQSVQIRKTKKAVK